ncbi:DUF1007 family protein [bacterium]
MVVNWKFDDMFSQSLITDYDIDKDGSFNDKELKVLYNGAFINLKNYGYFMHIKIDGKKYKIDKVEKFYAFIEEGVCYSFVISCNIKLNKSKRKICFSVYDPSYYCDVSKMTKYSVFLENADNIDYNISIAENENDAFYYGQIAPQELLITMRLKDNEE